MQRPDKGICSLWTSYTLCHFTAMNNIYASYTGHLPMRAYAAGYALTYFTIPKGQLVI
jgi:hypothetical protein